MNDESPAVDTAVSSLATEAVIVITYTGISPCAITPRSLERLVTPSAQAIVLAPEPKYAVKWFTGCRRHHIPTVHHRHVPVL